MDWMMIQVRNLPAGHRRAGKPLSPVSKPLARATRFVVDGHPFLAIVDPAPAELESGATLVGRITSKGKNYLIYDADRDADETPSAAEILTRRELQIALLIGDGKCDKEIARQLGISGYTVREHIRRIFAKLQIGRRSAIVACVLR